MNGSISPSPLSYKDWFSTRTAATNAMIQATSHILEIAEYLANKKKSSGIPLHLDIEPEPDGLLAHPKEYIVCYDSELLPKSEKGAHGKECVTPCTSWG